MNPNFSELVSSIKTDINDGLRDYISTYQCAAPKLKEAMQYSLLNGGKRMRPVLATIVGNLLGADRNDIVNVAMAIECVHAYSLIHDDLPAMDDDDLRRGKPTNHIKYGDATAILAGDALQTLAFELLTTCPMTRYGESKRIELIKILASSSGMGGMCAGQSIDLEATGRNISIEQLGQLHALKTGALLKASIMMAAHLAPDTGEQDFEHLDIYADNIGLAFQVQDDILDVIGDSETLGKPQGSDQSLEKSTYVSHLGVEGATEFLHSLQNKALSALEALPYNTAQLKAFTDYLVNRNH